MTKQTHRRCPWTGLAGLGVLAAAGILAATALLHTGWQALGVTLQDQMNDATRLEGFHLSGAVAWTGTFGRLHFTLQDGVLQTSLQLDDPQSNALAQAGHGIGVVRTYGVLPEQRGLADRSAVETGEPGGTRQLHTPMSQARRMYTLHLPDGTALRLAAGDILLEETALAWATDNPRLGELDSHYDYTLDSASAEEDAAWPQTPVSGDAFPLGAGYGLCWKEDFLGLAPGLYRAHGLTDDAVAALPRDGTVQGKEVLCATTVFGTLEPFYCPADARWALAGASMADGSTLLVYVKEDFTLCADLVDAAGRCTDHRELTGLGQAIRVDGTLLARNRHGDATLQIQTFEEDLGDGFFTVGPEVLALLRAENGRFTVARHLVDRDALYPWGAFLDETGDEVLVLYDDKEIAGQTPATPEPGGVNLRVYQIEACRVTYQGRLLTGAERDWARKTLARDPNPVRFVQLDTLQADGGLLP